MENLTITKLVKEVDLRRVHAYRFRYMKRIKVGSAVLLMNVKRDKCRFIDSVGGVHNYYAPRGELFDLDLIEKHLGALNLAPTMSAKIRSGLTWKRMAA
jgi:hypothetical protein